MPFTVTAAGQVYKHTVESVHLRGAISVDRDLSVEVTRRPQRAWSCFRRHKTVIYDHPGVRLPLKVQILKAESIRNATVWGRHVEPKHGRSRQSTAGQPQDAPSMPRLAKTEARRPHPIFTPTRLSRQASKVLRRWCANRGHCSRDSWHILGEGHVTRRVMFGEMVESKGYSGGKEKEWIGCLEKI